MELARVLSALGRTNDAAAQVERALVTFEALGASGEAARARRLTGSSGPATGGLTEREHEVLRLLARGHSNQEIADQLVLSIRTVQRHVENIYAKTGARGRAAAGAFAASHNLL
jgi:DNA-binding NarL/FixJ family response regulator